MSPFREGAEALDGVRQVVKDTDAVDEVVLPAQHGDVVERHVMELGIIGVADEIGLCSTLLCHLKARPRRGSVGRRVMQEAQWGGV